MAVQNPDRAVALSATLALIVAGWSLLARLLRAGIIAELLSTPLLVGYLAGGAVLMVVGQLGKMTGTSSRATRSSRRCEVSSGLRPTPIG